MKLVPGRLHGCCPCCCPGVSITTNMRRCSRLAPPIDDAPLRLNLAPANLPAPVITIPKTDKPVIVVQEQPPKPPPKHTKTEASAGTTAANPAAGQPGTQVAAKRTAR